MKNIKEYNEMLTESYSDQTGAKTAFFDKPGVSNLLDTKSLKFAKNKDTKMFIKSNKVFLTDGKRAIVMDISEPVSVITPLGKAPKDLAALFEGLNEAKDDMWYIVKVDEDGEDEIVHRYNEFEKNKIQKDFDEIVSSLKDEEEVHFMKDSKKYIGEYILSVVNQDGSLKKEIVKGNKVYYKKYKNNLINESKNVVKSLSDDAMDNYEDIIKKHPLPWTITNVATSSEDHPGYDEGMGGEELYDFKDKKGKDVPVSLYAYELYETLKEYENGKKLTINISKSEMEKLHKDGSIEIDLEDTTYMIKFD